MPGHRYRPPAAAVTKVPAVGPYFWVVKLLTTAMGEAVSDFLVQKFNPYLAVMASFVVFAIAIVWQFRTPAYRTWPYWSAVAMVAVFGTMVADAMHVGMGVPYKVSATLFAVCLVVIFLIWYRVEGTLSIHSITTPRREFFYWATVCTTFAMGTALGDLSAQIWHLGYFGSAVAFTAAIMIPLVLWRLGVNAVFTFWTAYILTRPIGASFADGFGMPKQSGGLGVGHGPVSLVTLILVLGSFVYLSRSGIDAPAVDAADEVRRGRTGGADGRDWAAQGWDVQQAQPAQQAGRDGWAGYDHAGRRDDAGYGDGRVYYQPGQYEQPRQYEQPGQYDQWGGYGQPDNGHGDGPVRYPR